MGFQEHSYLLHPVRGYAKYTKLGYKDLRSADQPAQKALVNLDDVTLSLSQVRILYCIILVTSHVFLLGQFCI
jgi:hypothetical protein